MRNKILGFIISISLIVFSFVATKLCNDVSFYHQYKEEKNSNILNADEVDEMYSNWIKEPVDGSNYLLNEFYFRNLAGEILNVSPLTRYSSINNGLYLLTQKNEDSIKNKCKYGVLIKPYNEAEELDTNLNIFDSFVDYNYFSTNKRVLYAVNLNGHNVSEIKKEFAYFEKCIYSSDFNSEIYGHKVLVNELNFTDYFLIYELAYPGYYNEENFIVYKDENDRYCLCSGMFEGCGVLKNDSYHNLLGTTWFNMLVKSETFNDNIINEYKYLRSTVFSENFLINELNETVDFLTEYNNIDKEALLNQKEELESYLYNRLNWLDDNIDSLKEFSALSATKEYTLKPY